MAYAIAGHLQSHTTKELGVLFQSSLEHNPPSFNLKLSHTNMFSKLSVVIAYVLITLAAATPHWDSPRPRLPPRPPCNAASTLFPPLASKLPASLLS
ncbi:hypothetical protein MVEN_00794900 [Mycena venus]|uniref:Uncharacterized protein n=1 Tax=Mycena venus TaxID=2733690 RepID=A0A8H6YKB5_9AGAR|nr:hypothetical protein MVEN_00794900 [Mycena venus]